ncbi:MAG: LamG domain-containing protein [Sedimentisphaerales bacterium]|nr:LamG domain-containing protein [Sedimentisphaerales bacterium]
MNGLRELFTRQRIMAVVLILCAGIGLTTAADVKPGTDRDFGDAPEGALAYPSSGVIGQFPTCVGVGPAAWVEHDGKSLYLGPKVDLEANGNAGQCPSFNPNAYNQDEGIKDGDAGLLKPRAYSIRGAVGAEDVYSLVTSIGLLYLGNANTITSWGVNLDLEVHNRRTDGRDAYLNVLMDWDQNGKWQGSALGPDGPTPEHTLVNFPIPHGFDGPLSELSPPGIALGPNAGYVWARFTISERPVAEGWNGDGVFTEGETEDYLLRVAEPVFFCEWDEGDPHKMHWPQVGDMRETGLAVDMFETSLAEDFQCAQTGPITDIHFWGAFMDDTLPVFSVDSLKFKVSIYANLPADDKIAWSRPGQLLWSKEILPYTYDFHQTTGFYRQGWYDPASGFYQPSNHRKSFQYNICLRGDDKELFTQQRGTIYWIEIKEIREADASYVFGWKPTERRLQFKDNAVWRHPVLGWQPISYPDGHEYKGSRLDLSLVITGRAAAEDKLDFGDAPDPKYPTLLASNSARHTVVPGVYLGNDVDTDPDGQPDATATGDDNDGTDDEDGVAFVSVPVQGDAAAVEVIASTTGALNAWVDFNSDGDWNDRGEQVFVDETLSPGVNTLAFVVPDDAVPGQTFSRWRFSSIRGLGVTGAAPDGEVEDHVLRIEMAGAPGQPPVEHLKWSQPPIERTPGSNAPVFCGWDEPSYTSKPFQSSISSWRMVADDFRCPGSLPVASVHWWGSYQDWEGREAPNIRPQSWRIGFWSNIPADSRYPFSRPGDLLWVVNASTDRVSEQRVGTDTFPGEKPDTAFEYLLKLEPQEYFQPGEYKVTGADEGIFWVSITAVYTGSPTPSYVWGWKTRPEPWMDGAVTFDLRRDDLRAGITPDPATVAPLTNSLVCERLDMYDMAFELDTDPLYVKWEQPFTGLRDWPHYEDEESVATGSSGAGASKWLQNPDLTRTGMDVDMTKDAPPTWPAQLCGDDFECTTSGPITGITIWGSWYHDLLSSGSPENVAFTLSIREDIPASRSSTGYSMPGRVLWRKQFARGTFTVQSQDAATQSYYSPGNLTFDPENHRMVYKYMFDIEPKDAFRQTGTAKDPVTYWLCAQASLVHSPGSVATRLGWKSSLDHWNDAAVWANAQEPFDGTWQKLTYPKGHSLSTRSVDLAFEIEMQGAATGLTYRRLVADDWECNSTAPVSSIVWWGSYLGYGYQACECQQMPAPRQPDYFLLSIWSDASNPGAFGHPGEKLWEYRADDFDEVMVGFDKHPEPFVSSVKGFEPVYRYTVRLPEKDWFSQRDARSVCWLSVVAVYEDARMMTYPWGWTNHPSEPWDVPGRNLVGHWKLDESSGEIANDSSGNGNHGTVVGRPDWRPGGGTIGGAIDLNGRDEYIRVSKPNGFDFAPGSFSASAWVKARTVGGRWQTIMEYDRDSFNGNRFGLWIDPAGRFHFRVGRNTWQTTASLKANTWHLLTATYDGDTHRMRLYIDGVLDAAATNVAGFVAPVQSTLTIGVRGSQDDEFLDGLLDDVRVYDVSLSDEEVLRLIGVNRNNDAVAGTPKTIGTTPTWQWTELFDQTGVSEDMSFMLFTEPLTQTTDDDSVLYIEGPWPTEEVKATGQSKK